MLKGSCREGKTMYKFIYVDKEVLKKLPNNVYEFFWMPMLMTRLLNCKPKNLYLFDCIFTQVTENPYALLMLLSKIPQKTRVVDTMPFNARKITGIKCSVVDVVQNLNAMANEITSNNYTRLYQIIEKVSEFEDVVISYRVFLRTKRYVIPAEKVKESTLRIASKTAKKALEHLCCIEKDMAKSIEIEEAQPVYTLAFFSKDFSDGGIVVGKKIIRFKSLAKFMKSFKEYIAKAIV